MSKTSMPTISTLVLDQCVNDKFAVYNADCVEVAKNIPDNSIDFIVFSPPFSSLYTYSASDRDMGNSSSDDEFFHHYEFLIAEMFRILKPGRLLSFHCMNLPTSKARDGVIGIKDFRGDLIRQKQAAGFIYHSEVVIWKDPVTAMQRTKALGLLHKQILKDSCMSRQGIPDYLVTMRKPGENPEPVEGPFDRYVGEDGTGPNPVSSVCERCNGAGFTVSEDPEDLGTKYKCVCAEPGSKEVRFSIEVWQRYASPVWMDINPSDTLQFRSAREHADERHICPLQLQVIERAMELWTNPNDIVFSPFTGIGSEGYVSVKNGRRFIGAELKASYFGQAVRNIQSAREESEQPLLF